MGGSRARRYRHDGFYSNWRPPVYQKQVWHGSPLCADECDQANNIDIVGESVNRFLAPPWIPGCNPNQIPPSTPSAQYRLFLTSRKLFPAN
jgi:hypothetical protein